jgi:hypothetical protein
LLLFFKKEVLFLKTFCSFGAALLVATRLALAGK